MYNEQSVIEETATTLTSYLDMVYGDDYELIFYDDGSSDRCAEIVRELALPMVRLIEGKENHGKGRGVRMSILASRGEYVMFTDADNAYGCETVKRMLDTVESDPNAQLAIGSRNISADGYDGYTFIRKVASKAYIKLLGLIGGFRLSDSQCGCKAFKGESIRPIMERCKVDSFAFDLEIILRAQRAGLGIIEVPVKVLKHKDSKVHLRDAFTMPFDILKIKSMLRREAREAKKGE